MFIQAHYQIRRIDDDQGMTAARLYCSSPYGEQKNEAKPFGLREGAWRGTEYSLNKQNFILILYLGKKSCKNGDFSTGFQMKIEQNRGFIVDDTAANDVEMKCQSGILQKGDGTPWGKWRGWVYCPKG